MIALICSAISVAVSLLSLVLVFVAVAPQSPMIAAAGIIALANLVVLSAVPTYVVWREVSKGLREEER